MRKNTLHYREIVVYYSCKGNKENRQEENIMSKIFIEKETIERAKENYEKAIEACKNAGPAEIRDAIAYMRDCGSTYRAFLNANYSI